VEAHVAGEKKNKEGAGIACSRLVRGYRRRAFSLWKGGMPLCTWVRGEREAHLSSGPIGGCLIGKEALPYEKEMHFL